VSRILVLCDDGIERDLLAQAIASAPHTVKTMAPSEWQAGVVRDWSPDIIVMELATDGASLPIRINMLRDPELSRIPFVALGDSEDEARALGAHGFVRAPAHLESLLGMIARFAAIRMPLPA
jgi:CheY-like chemotaxis protein